MSTFTIAGGVASGPRPVKTTSLRRPTATSCRRSMPYRCHKTTSYYDGNDNLISRRSTPTTCCASSTVDATGAQTSASLYMTQLAPTRRTTSRSAPACRPAKRRTVTTEYDSAGRVVRTEYPQVEVTTLTGADLRPSFTERCRHPRSWTATTPSATGCESIDRNGNDSFAYFDLLGCAIATVDAGGFLVETDLRRQGNVVQQRKYTAARDRDRPAEAAHAAGSAATWSIALRRREPPDRGVLADREDRRVEKTRFLSASHHLRLRRQRQPDPHTVAAGTSEAATEHYYYDGSNRRVAVVTAGRALNVFGYDDNGNRTSRRATSTRCRMPWSSTLWRRKLVDAVTRVSDARPGDGVRLRRAEPADAPDRPDGRRRPPTTSRSLRLRRGGQRHAAHRRDPELQPDRPRRARPVTRPSRRTVRLVHRVRRRRQVGARLDRRPAGRGCAAGDPCHRQRGGGLTISWQHRCRSQSSVVWDMAPHDVTGSRRRLC